VNGHAEMPVEWFGQLVPRVGDELELVVVARVSKIEQEQIDLSSWEPTTRGETIGGETRVTLVLSQLKMNMDELERVVKVTR
jgi:hypothetical protein